MPTLATSSTTIGPNSETLRGFQLCEFCEARGIPNDNPESVCECTEITRTIASWNATDIEDGRDLPEYIDNALRIAETAVLEQWGGFWDDSATVTKSALSGRCDDEYVITIEFEGTLFDDLDKPYQTEDGVARIRAFVGNGKIRIGVTLADDQTETQE